LICSAYATKVIKIQSFAAAHASAFSGFHSNSPQSSGSGCPFPRNENNTIANVIATPIATPYAAIPDYAMKHLPQNQQ